MFPLPEASHMHVTVALGFIELVERMRQAVVYGDSEPGAPPCLHRPLRQTVGAEFQFKWN